MAENHFRKLLKEGKPTLGTRLQSSLPNYTEIVGRSGKYDYVEFLAEYAPYTLHDLDNLGRAIELFPNFSGLIKMERWNQEWLAVRSVAAGIQNLLFTDVRTVEDAKHIVRTVKPETPEDGGTHGMAGGRGAASTGGGAGLVQSYRDSVIMIMVEKKDCVENLEAILDVPGIDMVQFGPSDYGMSIGQAGQRTSQQVVEAREFTIKTALKKGVRPRAEISDASEAEYYLKLGVKDFCMAPDAGILARYYNGEGGKLREMLSGL